MLSRMGITCDACGELVGEVVRTYRDAPRAPPALRRGTECICLACARRRRILRLVVVLALALLGCLLATVTA